MKLQLNKKELRCISLTLACWGLLLIGSGIAMTTKSTTVIHHKYSVSVYQSRVAESKTNEIKLKDMVLEVNTPLSVDVKDYLENVDKIDKSVLNALKLDTSNVKPQEPGTYIYTISYKKKKYNGIFTIKEKELPVVNLSLKNLRLPINSVLDTNLTTYIVSDILTDEVKQNIVLDLSAVKTNAVGTYQYTVTYNNRIYTANIEIYNPQPVKTPNTADKEPTDPTTPDDKTTVPEN